MQNRVKNGVFDESIDFEELAKADIELAEDDVEAMDPTQIYLREIEFRALLTAVESDDRSIGASG